MHEQITEERFDAAARNLRDRWGSFDFVRSVQSGDTTLFTRLDWDRPFVPNLAESLFRDIDNIGAVAAIKRRLHTESEDSALLDLAASNRLDLTIEFLTLRPAWKSLFDEVERRTAATRLLQLLSLSGPNGSTPPTTHDLDCILDWLIDRIARWEVDSDLPKSRASYGWQDPSSRMEQTWCESVADTAREFSEIGGIPISLTQSNHYLHCGQCRGAFPELERQFRRFESTTISQCHELLKLLGVCLERAAREQSGKGGGLVSHDDEFAWRAIVCGAGLMYNDSITEFSRILSEVAGGHVPEPSLRRLLLDFDRGELHSLSFAEAASGPFIEMQWSLYDNDDLIYLPSDGDLWDVPHVVVVLNAPEVGEWKRLMTGSDLKFPSRNRDGRDSTLYIDGKGLFRALYAAAEFHTERRVSMMAATGQGPVPELRTAPKAANEERLAGPTMHVDSSVAASREDTRIQILLDRMTELHDLVASNSAAQVPIIDTLQSVVNRIDSPSRYRAEESARLHLGHELYDKLSPKARHSAIAAEYCWLDVNAPDPSRIVADLSTAFEHQLRETVFTLFCNRLLASGMLNYPERPGSLPSLVSKSPSSPPRPGLPNRWGSGSDKPIVPTLLENGRITTRLTLGEMQKLLERPLPALCNFLAQSGIHLGSLMDVLPEITRKRNRAVHEGQPSLREEASHIRRRWLGKTHDFPNIFAVLLADGSTGSAAGTRP